MLQLMRQPTFGDLEFLTKWDLLRLIRFTTQHAPPSQQQSDTSDDDDPESNGAYTTVIDFLHRLEYLRHLLGDIVRGEWEHSELKPPVDGDVYSDLQLIQDALFGMEEQLADRVRQSTPLIGTGFHVSELAGFGTLRPRLAILRGDNSIRHKAGLESRTITWEKFVRVVADCQEFLDYYNSQPSPQSIPQVSRHLRNPHCSSALTILHSRQSLENGVVQSHSTASTQASSSPTTSGSEIIGPRRSVATGIRSNGASNGPHRKARRPVISDDSTDDEEYVFKPRPVPQSKRMLGGR